MIYSPIPVNSDKCYEYQNTDILRIYDSINLNVENNYTDYNTSNHYSSKTGSVLLETLPTCINHEDLSHEFYYRNDLAHIFIIIAFLFIVIFYFPFRLITRFYKRGRF